jgi:hypothetical protein
MAAVILHFALCTFFYFSGVSPEITGHSMDFHGTSFGLPSGLLRAFTEPWASPMAGKLRPFRAVGHKLHAHSLTEPWASPMAGKLRPFRAVGHKLFMHNSSSLTYSMTAGHKQKNADSGCCHAGIMLLSCWNHAAAIQLPCCFHAALFQLGFR